MRNIVIPDVLLTRRRMCGLVAAAPFALWPGDGRGAEPAAPLAMRQVLASSLYGCTRLEEVLAEVRKTGADAVDLWPRRHADQREQVEAMGYDRFAELLRRHRVRLGMTTRYDLGPFGLGPELGFLARFGAKLVVTGSAGPSDLSGPKCRAAVRQFVEKMKPHVAEAERHGVTIAIENHLGALVSTSDSLRYLAELSPSPSLGIALAPYHLPQDERLLAGLIEDLGPRLAHFYAWQHGKGCMQKQPKADELQQMPGRGKLDFRPLLAALRKIRYAGGVEIFMHPFPRGIPILETTAKVTEEVNRARRYLESSLR
jgi:sugar phosphate isomerase/epimerase